MVSDALKKGRLASGFVAAGLLIGGAGDMSAVEAQDQLPQPKIVGDDRGPKEEARAMTRELEAQLKARAGQKAAADPEAIQKLIDQMGDNQFRVREKASRELEKIGYPAKSLILKALRENSDAEIRHRAGFIMDHIRYAEQKWAAALLPVVNRLGVISAEAKGAVPVLTALLAEDSPELRKAAIGTLGQIGPDAKEAAPEIAKALKDKDEDIQQAAAMALGKMGAAAKSSVPHLITALKDKEPDVRVQAVQALGDIGPDAKEAVPALIDVIKGDEAEVRKFAIVSLGQIGPEAKAAVKPMAELLTYPDSGVKQAAARTLGKFGADAKDAVPALVKALGDPESPVKRNAVASLKAIGPDAKPAVAALRELSKSEPTQDEIIKWGVQTAPLLRKEAAAAADALESARGR